MRVHQATTTLPVSVNAENSADENEGINSAIACENTTEVSMSLTTIDLIAKETEAPAPSHNSKSLDDCNSAPDDASEIGDTDAVVVEAFSRQASTSSPQKKGDDEEHVFQFEEHIHQLDEHDHNYCDEGCYKISSSDEDDILVLDDDDVPLDFEVNCTARDDTLATVFPEDYEKSFNILNVKSDGKDTMLMSGDIIKARNGEAKIFVGVLLAHPHFNSNLVPVHILEEDFKLWLSKKSE
jgi:hypothetical protein